MTRPASAALVMFLAACGGNGGNAQPNDEGAATPSASLVQHVAQHEDAGAWANMNASQLYAAHCAVCHGETGRGDGAAAYLLYPKPRDFTAMFRFKSTPGDQPPTRDDVARIISQGIERTAMPSFAALFTDEQVADLADYVLAMNPRSSDAAVSASGESIVIPPAPRFTAELAEQGRLLYAGAGCVMCHGETGRGDGPSSPFLADNAGLPLPAADFTAGVFKAGRTDADLYRTLVLGVPGTPMPSYASSLESLNPPGVEPNTDKIWALVAYLRSIETPREPAGARSDATIAAAPLNDDAPLNDPWHAAWDSLPSTAVSVQPLWQRASAPRAVEVRAAVRGQQLALCLEWRDETVDNANDSVDAFADAAAVMFSMTGDVPVLTMGAATLLSVTSTDQPALVNLWQWKATWQANADAHALRDLRDRGGESHQGVPADLYMFKSGDPVAGPIDEHDKTFIPAWATGNVRANPTLIERSVLESNAAGFGSLTLQQPAEQHVTGNGRWRDGRWRVVMVRTLAPGGDGDVAFNDRHPIAFAVWDGSAGDRNGTKLISGWHWLECPAERP